MGRPPCAGGNVNELPACVVRYIDAYNAFDVQAMVGCLTHDIHFVNRSGTDVAMETQGIDAFRDLAAQGAAVFSQRRQRVTNAIVAPGHATVEIDYQATVAVDLPNGWTAGQVISLRGVSLFTLRDDRIAVLIDIA